MPRELWRTHNPSTGLQSYLHESNWLKHSLKRPELNGCLDAVLETVEDPDFALRDNSGTVYKYRKDHGLGGKFSGCRLLVIEGADADGKAHHIKTMYFVTRIESHELLYFQRF